MEGANHTAAACGKHISATMGPTPAQDCNAAACIMTMYTIAKDVVCHFKSQASHLRCCWPLLLD
jgi:hypothetical protein